MESPSLVVLWSGLSESTQLFPHLEVKLLDLPQKRCTVCSICSSSRCVEAQLVPCCFAEIMNGWKIIVTDTYNIRKSKSLIHTCKMRGLTVTYKCSFSLPLDPGSLPLRMSCGRKQNKVNNLHPVPETEHTVMFKRRKLNSVEFGCIVPALICELGPAATRTLWELSYLNIL